MAKQCNNTLNLTVLCSQAALPADTADDSQPLPAADDIEQVTADVKSMSVSMTTKKATNVEQPTSDEADSGSVVMVSEKKEEETKEKKKSTDVVISMEAVEEEERKKEKRLFFLQNAELGLVVDIAGERVNIFIGPLA